MLIYHTLKKKNMKKILLFLVVCVFSVYSYSQTIKVNKEYICNNETVTYTISNVPAGGTVTWQSYSNMVLQGSATGTTATYKANFVGIRGYARVTAAITQNGRVSYVDNTSLWVGGPEIPYGRIIESDNYSNQVPMGRRALIKVEGGTYGLDITSYDWKLYDWQRFLKGYYSENGIDKQGVYVELQSYEYPESSALVVATPMNRCGSGTSIVTTMYASNSSYYRSVPENSEPATVKVYSFSTGKLVHQEKAAINFNIQSTTLENGIYIVETTNSEGQVTRNKVMKEQ